MLIPQDMPDNPSIKIFNVGTDRSQPASTAMGGLGRGFRLLGAMSIVVFGAACGGGNESQPTSPATPTGETASLYTILGPGVTGSPAAGLIVSKQDSVVHYTFTPDAAHQNVVVVLDDTTAVTTGTISMKGVHVLEVGADEKSGLSVTDLGRVQAFRTAVLAPGAVTGSQDLLSLTNTLVGQLGPDSASQLLAALDAAAVDPVRDSALIRRANIALDGAVFDSAFSAPTNIGASGNLAIPATLASRSVPPGGNAYHGSPLSKIPIYRDVPSRPRDGTGSPLTIIYINGIQTDIGQALADKTKLIGVVDESGFGITQTGMYELKLSFNATFESRSADRDAKCLFLASHTLVAWLLVAERLAQCGGLIHDLTVAHAQMYDLINYNPGSGDPDVQRLAALIGKELSRGRAVLLVGHSQGTLIAELAIRAVAGSVSSASSYPNACLGNLEIAAPVSYAGPPLAAQQGLIIHAGSYGNDILFALGKNHDTTVASQAAVADEKLFTNLSAAHAGVSLIPDLIDLFWRQVQLHYFRSSYLGDPVSHAAIIKDLQAMIPAVATSCADLATVISTVLVSPSSLSVRVGGTTALTVVASNAAGQSVTGQPIQWSTSDPAIATVSGTGVVTGVAPGTATITASVSGVRGTTTITVTAVPLGTAPPLFSIAPNSHTCALAATGSAYCWGNGFLGNGTSSGSNTPVPVSGGNVFITIVSGSNHSCALTAAGIAMCWGSNDNGQLGDGSAIARTAPVAVAGGHTFASLFASNATTCALTSDGTAYCWGFNRSGQLGNGSESEINSNPATVSTNMKFVRLTLGDVHTCGLTADGAAYCWGDNQVGQLGVGTVSNACSWTVGPYQCALTPVPVQTTQRFVTISAGGSHSCGLTSGGQAYCWGKTQGTLAGDTYGLGDGTTTNSPTPIPVANGMSFSTITAGNQFTCALAVAGSAFCWGRNANGTLGDGTGTSQLSPVTVSGGYTFGLIMSGYQTTCGRLASDGSIYCWGLGPLGDGSTNGFSSSPVRVAIP